MNPRTLALLFAVLASVCFGCGSGNDDDHTGGLSTDSCGVLGLKIIDGTPCTETNSPVVFYNVSYSDLGGSACSGTLITDRDVLTAGHCFINAGRTVTSISVFVNGVAIAAEDFAIHPKFREVSDSSILGGVAIFNDVALVRLSSPVGVAPVPLITSRQSSAGDVIDIFGYGLDEKGNAGRLRSGEMQLDQATSDVIVSVFDGEDGSNTCQGDSGGPAIFSSGSLIGIVGITSSGVANALCFDGDISVFTNTQSPSVLAFIRQLAPGVRTI